MKTERVKRAATCLFRWLAPATFNRIRSAFVRLDSLDAEVQGLRRDLRKTRQFACALADRFRPPFDSEQLRERFSGKELFVLGSGPSILDLSNDEREYVANSASISMGRYLIFWEKVGLWPNFHFCADSLGVAASVFQESIDVIRVESDRQPPLFLLERFYADVCPVDLPCVFFDRDDRKGNNLEWAKSWTDPLFFCRGSLTSLLNAVSLLGAFSSVKLLGVDLNRPGYFFQPELQAKREFNNPWDDEASKLGKHATIANVNGWKGSMLDGWPELMDKLRECGIRLTCCNASSALVQDGLCEFSPVIPASDRCLK